MKLGLCGSSAEKWASGAAAGFKYAEINLHNLVKMTPEEFQSYKAQVRKSPLKIRAANVFLPTEVKVVGPNANEAQQSEYLKAAFKRGAQLGIKMVVFGSSGARRIPELARDKAFSQAVDFGRLAAKIAKRFGILIVVENLGPGETNFLNSVEQVYDYVRAVERPNFGVAADFYHMGRENEDLDIILKVGTKF